MSFDCRWKTNEAWCERLQGECRPGIPGCTLYGKVVMADASRQRRKAPKRSAGSPGTGDGTAVQSGPDQPDCQG